MRKVCTIDKRDYQKKLKPLLESIGFKTTNYTRFVKDNFVLIFYDDKYNHTRIYDFRKIYIKPYHSISLYYGKNVDELVKEINFDMIHYLRKNKIEKILNETQN